MDTELARANMIESQIRPWEVLDQRILDLFTLVRREIFVPPARRQLAFADLEIPIGHGEVMLSPKTEARLTQELGLSSSERVLEIGTGSGHHTALLASLAREVVTIEIIPEFSSSARKTLASIGIDNVTFETGSGELGLPRHAPYDAILVTGSVASVHEALRNQLAPGGRLLAVVGMDPIMTATLVTRIDSDCFDVQGLFETSIPRLRTSRDHKDFVF
ncbi:MAG: protein-L-isoaspartate O-methyltransferase [Betaproteobacteria bacterium]|jgi:protein-L-isoaspartate(D-aspartate) O-methyltransferase